MTLNQNMLSELNIEYKGGTLDLISQEAVSYLFDEAVTIGGNFP
jgi:hypothetical protein